MKCTYHFIDHRTMEPETCFPQLVRSEDPFILLKHLPQLLQILHLYPFAFFFPQYWDLNSGPIHLEPLCQPFFLWRVFQDRVLWTICLVWLQTSIFLISASWVARITGVSHRHLAPFAFYHSLSLCFNDLVVFLPLMWLCALISAFPWQC
jgi:hypothetical protein